MYKCAIAAITMTAAALLLAATPAIADDDYNGPVFGVCGTDGTKLIRMQAPMVLFLSDRGCHPWDDESLSHLMK
ncbi:hypothetical protein [Nonomuraea candida]|uniref:hypothetical protein n=1 Tax=Nonomuraea candida TaxID=359159 RepID=UPI0005B8D355|nr:hypothetical protein [Nonomuraea candida]